MVTTGGCLGLSEEFMALKYLPPVMTLRFIIILYWRQKVIKTARLTLGFEALLEKLQAFG